MKPVAILVFGLLTVIAALHAYWGIGGLWPGATTKELIDTVIGVPEMHRMPPPWMTFTVAALIFAAGLFALARASILPLLPRWIVTAATVVLTLVFLGRAAAGFWIAATGSKASEPFATYDLWLYSPFCLLIGVMFAALLLRNPKVS